MAYSNLSKIKRIAKALGDLNAKVVFVGGAVAELYADNPELSDIRPTMDVDCVLDIAISTYVDYSRLEKMLHTFGFKNDQSDGAPICRKIYQDIIVDFMPVNPDILGFSNQWYADGWKNRQTFMITNELSINILSVEYYVATKFEALIGRGGTDIRGSHDWEDIVYIMSNCNALSEAVRRSKNENLHNYLKQQMLRLLENDNIREIIYTALPYESAEESIDAVLQVMRSIVAQ